MGKDGRRILSCCNGCCLILREIKKHPQYKFELFEKSFWTIQIRLRKEFLIGNYL